MEELLSHFICSLENNNKVLIIHVVFLLTMLEKAKTDTDNTEIDEMMREYWGERIDIEFYVNQIVEW